MVAVLAIQKGKQVLLVLVGVVVAAVVAVTTQTILRRELVNTSVAAAVVALDCKERAQTVPVELLDRAAAVVVAAPEDQMDQTQAVTLDQEGRMVVPPAMSA